MHAHKLYVYEMHTYEMHAYEVQALYTPIRYMPVRCTPIRCTPMRCHRKTICVRSTPHANSSSPEFALEFAPPIHSVDCHAFKDVGTAKESDGGKVPLRLRLFESKEPRTGAAIGRLHSRHFGEGVETRGTP
jgi:hypothetical protein